MTMPFSAQLSNKQNLATKIFTAAIKENKLARAYILAGHALADKKQLVKELTAYLNCAQVKSGASKSCLVKNLDNQVEEPCTNCKWLATEEHPQALLVLSGQENKSGKISVEQARKLVDEISKTSPYFRVIMIDDANQDIMHRPAANTLLKTVEEPRSNILMIFFASVISEVLPTIVSRCQVINMASHWQNDNKILSLNSLAAGLQNFSPSESILSSYEKFVEPSSTQLEAINLAEAIQNGCKEDNDLEAVLDFLMAHDLLNYKNIATNLEEASYAKELFLLNQIAKEQSKHYVSQKALIETFVFAWHKLKKTGINPLKIRG